MNEAEGEHNGRDVGCQRVKGVVCPPSAQKNFLAKRGERRGTSSVPEGSRMCVAKQFIEAFIQKL